MAATPQTQGFLGGVTIAGRKFTVRGNPQFRANRNIDVTGMIGTGYPYLYAEGVQTPTITMSIVPRASGDGCPFLESFLACFLTRSAGIPTAPVWETPLVIAVGATDPAPGSVSGLNLATAMANAGIVFSDGETITCMFGVKAESVRISTAKGQDLMFDVTFVGTCYKQFRWTNDNAFITALNTLRFTASDCIAPLRFQSVTVSGDFADKVFGINLSWSNNHTPNMGLDGTVFPIAQNAGMPNAGLSLTLQALDSIPGDLLTPSSFSFTVLSIGIGSVTFTMPKPVVYNPYDRSAPMGRVLRNYNYTLLGDCTQPNVFAGSMVIPTYTGNFNDVA